MEKKNYAFGKTNYILIAVGLLLIISGFLLMTGKNCTYESFEPDIFSVRRIKVAPIVCLAGFITMICAIAYKPRNKSENADNHELD